MAYVDPNVDEIVANLPAVEKAVRAERDKLAAIAEGLFASHDKPGGHEFITVDTTDAAFLEFIGPAPLAVEFGHWTPDHGEFVDGIHVITRAIDQAEAS